MFPRPSDRPDLHVLKVAVGLAASVFAILCVAKEPVRIEGLRHSWTWDEAGLAVKVKCLATPTGECHIRFFQNGSLVSVERVIIGQAVAFRFGSDAADYCVAIVAAKEAPCEGRFITAGFHFLPPPP